MKAVFLWDTHVDRMVQKLLELLGTKEYGENTLLKVGYSLRVVVGEIEKIILLGILFCIADCLSDFLIAFGTIVSFRICTGGIHRKTMLGCFFHSMMIFLIIVLLGKNIVLDNYVQFNVIITLVFLVAFFAPIQSRNRIRYSEKQRIYFKIKALTIVVIILLLERYIPSKQYNIIMSGILVHTLEMAFLVIQIRRKEEV